MATARTQSSMSSNSSLLCKLLIHLTLVLLTHPNFQVTRDVEWPCLASWALWSLNFDKFTQWNLQNLLELGNEIARLVDLGLSLAHRSMVWHDFWQDSRNLMEFHDVQPTANCPFSYLWSACQHSRALLWIRQLNCNVQNPNSLDRNHGRFG